MEGVSAHGHVPECHFRERGLHIVHIRVSCWHATPSNIIR